MENPIFRVGLVFSDVDELRHALTAYSIKNRRLIRKIKNDLSRLEAVCRVGCPWRLKAYKDSRSGGFIIKMYAGKHTCQKVWEMKALTAEFLTKRFMDEFKDNQKMDLKTFAAKVQRQFNMCPNRWKLGRARKAALQKIHGDEDAQFSLLWDYGQELRRCNPGSKFFLSTNEVKPAGSDVPQEHLATLYWSYDACKRGFLKGCRPLICLDGCHIKTKYKGQLLTAVGIDPNDCIYPVAMGLVEVECTSSWEWFLTTLRDDLNITNTAPWTIMSDKQKGLINAVQKIFPDAEHRFCVRHMLQNFQKAGHRGETLKNDVWAIARSTHIPKWQESMAKLQTDSLAALDWIEEHLVPKTWIKAFFSEFPKCDMLLNNHSEVFNSYILEAREVPILSMLETIFYKLVQRIKGKQREAEKWEGNICPKIKKKLDKFAEWSAGYFVISAGNQLFKVGTGDMEKSYIVDFNTKTCDCKRWQLSGIPCHHVIACCRNDNIDPELMVHSCYSVETYKQAYSHNLMPLRGRSHWEKTNGSKVHPPLYTKVMGRPKKNRKKAPEETEKKGATFLSKHGVTIHCSVCRKPGHNKKGHDKYVEAQQHQDENILQEDEDFDDPSIMQHLFPQNTNPSLDPTHQRESMVYRMGQEERARVPIQRSFGPLPESEFVVAARDSIPQAAVRATTATTRGRASMRSRGRGRTTARQAPIAPQAAARGNSRVNKRTSEASTSQAPEAAGNEHAPQAPEDAHGPQASVDEHGTQSAANARRRVTHNTGPGSFYHLLFGDNQGNPTTPVNMVPDLNAPTSDVA